MTSERFSTTSALYQLNYGVLCDLLVFKADDKEKRNMDSDTMCVSATYYYELPGDWTQKTRLLDSEHVWLIILEDHKQRCGSLHSTFTDQSGSVHIILAMETLKFSSKISWQNQIKPASLT